MIFVKIKTPKGDESFILDKNEHETTYTEEIIVDLIDKCIENEDTMLVVDDIFGEKVAIPVAMFYEATAFSIREIPM